MSPLKKRVIDIRELLQMEVVYLKRSGKENSICIDETKITCSCLG